MLPTFLTRNLSRSVSQKSLNAPNVQLILKIQFRFNRKPEIKLNRKYSSISAPPYIHDAIESSEDIPTDIHDPPLLDTNNKRSNPKLTITTSDAIRSSLKTPTNQNGSLPSPSTFLVKFHNDRPLPVEHNLFDNLSIIDSSDAEPEDLDLYYHIIEDYGSLVIPDPTDDVKNPIDDVRKIPIFTDKITDSNILEFSFDNQSQPEPDVENTSLYLDAVDKPPKPTSIDEEKSPHSLDKDVTETRQDNQKTPPRTTTEHDEEEIFDSVDKDGFIDCMIKLQR